MAHRRASIDHDDMPAALLHIICGWRRVYVALDEIKHAAGDAARAARDEIGLRSCDALVAQQAVRAVRRTTIGRRRALHFEQMWPHSNVNISVISAA